MPASYTHHLIAQQTLARMSAALQRQIAPHLPLYFFGAQGADFCFFYPVFEENNAVNFGSFLHRKGGYDAFAVCKAFSYPLTALFAYSLGYITHYAADVTFHPYVYATAGKSPLRHTRVEGALDNYFKAQFAKPNDYTLRFFHEKLSKAHLDELFLLYTAIAVNARFPPLQKPAFLRAVALFNKYLPRASALLHSKDNAIIDNLINKEKRTWTYPSAPEIIRQDSGDELLQKSVDFSIAAVDEFIYATKKRTPLSFATFGKNYLSGL